MKTYIVDAFTTDLFKGNQAGVCFIDDAFNAQNFLPIAKELGYSETAFLQKTDDSAVWKIRFFSPVMEIPLCGHATIAAAAVLFEVNETPALSFTNIDGLRIPITRHGDQIAFNFPIYNTVPATAPKELLDALGLTSVCNSNFNVETNILMLEIIDPKVLANLQPDFLALKASHDDINGVLVTAPSSEGLYDYHYRYFWPWSGTNEDPATGGVQTFLAPYWSERLGKHDLRSFQSSARTGSMQIIVKDRAVTIKSNARIALAGEMRI